MSDLVQNSTFSGDDWALEEVAHVRYEDCAFHDVDWSEARLTGCLRGLARSGVEADGWIGDADPMTAIADALAVFAADELLIATHPEERSNWLAHDLVRRARVRFQMPGFHVVVDLAAHRE